MRTLRTAMVLLALWGFLAPRVVACCCPKMAPGSQSSETASASKEQIAPVHSCCHASSDSQSVPASDHPDSQHDAKGCHGCYCGMFCCGKLVVPAPQVSQEAVSTCVDALAVASDTLPSSMALSPMLKPPRQA